MKRLVVAGCLLVVLLALLWRRERDKPATHQASTTRSEQATRAVSADLGRERAHTSPPIAARTAEEIVAGKVVQFGRNRREIIRAISWRTGKEIPPEVEKFFDAIEAGDWEQVDALG